MDGWIGEFTHILRIIKAKQTLDLVKCSMLLDSEGVRVQVLYVLDIREDEGLFRIKTKSYDVLDVANAHLNGLF